jgi:hypothetical protein
MSRDLVETEENSDELPFPLEAAARAVVLEFDPVDSQDGGRWDRLCDRVRELRRVIAQMDAESPRTARGELFPIQEDT